MNEIESIIRSKLVITNQPGVGLAAKEIEKIILKKELVVYKNLIETAGLYSDFSNKSLIIGFAKTMVAELEIKIKELK